MISSEAIDKMLPEDEYVFDIAHNPNLRDVTSTAKLFNFRRPVFMSTDVWDDCVDLQPVQGQAYDELAVLQRLRHVLFMAASALHGRGEDLEYDFRVYRVSNAGQAVRHPEPVNLHLKACRDKHNQPVINIDFAEKH